MAVYAEGASIGSVFGSPLVVTLTSSGQKVVTQVITAKDGKVGYIFRGKALMLAAKPAATKISGFVDADADQFLASDAETGFTEPANLVFNDIQFSYAEDGGTRVWQKKADVNAKAINDALAESGITGTVARSTSLGTQIMDFITKNIVVILIVAVLLFLVWANSGKKGKKSKGFSFGI